MGFNNLMPLSNPLVTSSMPMQYAVPASGETVTAQAGIGQLVIEPAGTLLSLTVALPASPTNGQTFRIASSQIVTTLTMTGGTIINALTGIALGGFASFVYCSNSSKWFRTG